MKNTLKLTALILATIFVVSCNFIEGVEGNGVIAEENRHIQKFSSIDVSGNVNVVLIPNSDPYVKLVADENLMELIITEVKGEELHIYTTQQIKGFKKLLVEIGVDDLQAIELSGAVDLFNHGTLRADRLEVDCSGAADLELDLKVEEIAIDLSGAGEITLSGRTEDLEMEISGAAEVITTELKADHVDLDVSGAAFCKVYAKKSLNVEASGAADVVYAGEPDKLRVDNSGASNVRAL